MVTFCPNATRQRINRSTETGRNLLLSIFDRSGWLMSMRCAASACVRPAASISEPIGFIHALFEVASDVLKRSEEIGNPKATIRAISDTALDTVVGKVDWKTTKIKNVAKTPLVGGQWRRTPEGPFKYQLVITENTLATNIPAASEMQPLPA